VNIVINLGIIGGLVFAVIVGFALADRIRGGGPIRPSVVVSPSTPSTIQRAEEIYGKPTPGELPCGGVWSNDNPPPGQLPPGFGWKR